MAFDTRFNFSADISEQGGPIVASPKNFVSCGLPKMIPSTKAAMELKNNFMGFLWAQTPQQHP
jgi:hypothetical protein